MKTEKEYIKSLQKYLTTNMRDLGITTEVLAQEAQVTPFTIDSVYLIELAPNAYDLYRINKTINRLKVEKERKESNTSGGQ